ncbi:hypothetical protein [Aporhodopirellula aestuarii]|uniref:Uncharacterized protein n=1 Tax=Aporhodopirellula aestuarii TaxID=2950107 RepID=A0ABT0TYY1_9BACT|nr:hypothetical protein [Aporhodopirellula aestuarii]MCM2369770.1 hypothetical protein [Aporhodopirellula aestuarii]
MPSLSDVEWIFVVLIVLYFLECLVWVRPGTNAFVSRWGSFHHRKPATRLTGNDRGRLVLAGLSPSDKTLLCQEMPVSMTDQGVVAFVPMSPLSDDRPLHSGEQFRWPELANCHVREREIRCGQRSVCHLNNTTNAKRFASELASIAAMDENDRGGRIELLRNKTYDVADIRTRLELLSTCTRWIRPLANMLLIWMGPIGAMLYYGFFPIAPDGMMIAAYLAILFSLWWTTAGLVYFAHRRLFRDDRSGRLKLVGCSLLSPAVPLRAVDYLSRELLATSIRHPLAVSAAVDSPDRFREVAERTMRDIEYPITPETPADQDASTSVNDDNASSIVMDSRAADWDAITALLNDSEISFETCLAAPEPDDDASVTYCPRCHQQFEIENANCDQCGGRETLKLRV